jgi:6,7-dimethyl-8-ribityllumazine synthase
VAVVASRFNDDVVSRLIGGALEALREMGSGSEDVPVHRVPGAFELPLGARRLAATGQWDAIVALGCVIRGETAHSEHVGRVAADGLARVSLDYGIPVGFGVLTTENAEQALARSGGEGGNLGFDAAVAAVGMAATLRTMG